METVRKNSKESNPVDIFAAQNEAIQKEFLKAGMTTNFCMLYKKSKGNFGSG